MATQGWDGVTVADLRRAATPRKYRNVRVQIDGETFDSKAEGAHWLVLRDRARRGAITQLQRQVAFPLFCPVTIATGRVQAAQVATYVADFVYVEAGVRHVVDVKRPATVTAVYRLKRKWLALQDGLVIEEVG